MNENINYVINDRIVFAEKPIKGKAAVGNRSIEFSRGFRMGEKGFVQCVGVEIRYMKRSVVKDVTRIIKMPAILKDVTVDEQAEKKKQSRVISVFL
ncbi:MAG: hypothetical protein D3909_07405 [Candidatus Electrothrix sp. ATG1]|nr:hypothetical protein [Candidatus Electrothrix sp. ATG1]